MALLDKRSTFARELSIPAEGGPTKFGEAIPLDTAVNLGAGAPLWLVISVPVAGVGGTSVVFEFVTSAVDALSSPTILWTSGTFLTAALTQGAILTSMALPSVNYGLFMGLRATVVGTYSAGKINAYLTMEPPAWNTYPEAVS